MATHVQIGICAKFHPVPRPIPLPENSTPGLVVHLPHYEAYVGPPLVALSADPYPHPDSRTQYKVQDLLYAVGSSGDASILVGALERDADRTDLDRLHAKEQGNVDCEFSLDYCLSCRSPRVARTYLVRRVEVHCAIPYASFLRPVNSPEDNSIGTVPPDIPSPSSQLLFDQLSDIVNNFVQLSEAVSLEEVVKEAMAHKDLGKSEEEDEQPAALLPSENRSLPRVRSGFLSFFSCS